MDAEPVEFPARHDAVARSSHVAVSSEAKRFSIRRANEHRAGRRTEADEKTIGKSVGFYTHPNSLRRFLQQRDVANKRPFRIGLVHRSVRDAFRLSPDEHEWATRLR